MNGGCLLSWFKLIVLTLTFPQEASALEALSTYHAQVLLPLVVVGRAHLCNSCEKNIKDLMFTYLSSFDNLFISLKKW